MWLYIAFCIALFYVVKTQSNTPENEPEEIFVDVIKNISRVNTVLQELISNYETLQKIYKSQENIDSSKYSDSNMDETFENVNEKRKSKTSKPTKKEKFAATEMYWSDQEEETKDGIKQSKDDHTEKGNVVEKDKNIVRQKPRTSTTTIKPEEPSLSRESSDSVESVLKKKIERSPKYDKENNNKAISKSSKAISKSIEAQTEFEESYAISSYQKYLRQAKKDDKTRSRKIYKAKDKSANTGLKIPHLNISNGVEAVHESQNANKVKKNHAPRADDNISTHKKKMASENLPIKTFYDLFKDTSIQLEAHSDIYMENVKNPITHKEKKSRNGIVPHKNKRRDIDKLRSTDSKQFHKKEDIDKVKAANATHHKFPKAENLRTTKSNDSHHKTKKHVKNIDNDTQIINNDHEKASIDHETNHKHHKTVDNDKEERSTDNDNKKTQDDNKRDDIGNKKAHENKKTNKRHKKADIETETQYKDHKTVNNNAEQMGTEAKNKEKKLYKEIQVNHEGQSSDESVFMDKNETNVLREAYGEACMKVVVRKCYKACTKSSKLVCSQTKCKSSLKSAFKQHSKTGCLERFTTAAERNAKNETLDLSNDDDMFSHKRRALQEKFTNLNAGGFQVCLPTLGVQTETTVKPSKQTTNKTDSTRRKTIEKMTDDKITFNILRDRFERACKKLSYKKCHDACTSSWDSACSTYDCSKRLKGLYKKHCKSSCKNAYGLNKKRSDSDGSSDSDDSSDSS